MKVHTRYMIGMTLVALWLIMTPCRGFSQQVHAELFTPPLSSNGHLLPVVVNILAGGQEPDRHFNGTFALEAAGATLQADSIRIFKGVGSTTTGVNAQNDFVLSIKGLDGAVSVSFLEGKPVTERQGILAGSETWTMDHDVVVTGDLTIPPGSKLQIEAGTQVFLYEKANIFVEGELGVSGEPTSPVCFMPFQAGTAWGGIQLLSTPDSTTFSHCFFIGGGGDEDHIYGHSQSQPVVMVENGAASFTDCCFLDNVGKATGGHLSRVRITGCIISRCDTGGEHHECHVIITDSRYTEMPDSDGMIDDDDNDGVYIAGNHPDAEIPSLVKGCIFMTGEDDGIDHNGANLRVMNCWIEGFYHEGIAASNGNTIHVFNTLVRGCEQGIEAGYGTPQVVVDHCTVTGNATGLRFGDSYSWGCNGHMQVTNSILSGNGDNVLNYDNLIQGPVEGGFDITYTMTNDPDYDGGTGCVTGTPQFDNDFILLPGSFGTGLAGDGSDLGLVTSYLGLYWPAKPMGIIVYPNPCTDRIRLSVPPNRGSSFSVSLYDSQGNRLMEWSYDANQVREGGVRMSMAGYPAGLYILQVHVDGVPGGSVKILKIE